MDKINNVDDFHKTVPFDPGYSPLSFSFMENIAYVTGDYNQLKAMHQKKFKLSQLEPAILDLISKNASFYLGCMLWGGFLSSRFKDAPKEISGNHTLKLSDEAKASLDCADEAKFSLQYIEFFDKDCKYYLKKPAKVSDFVKEILNNYIEFAQINDNFINVTKTSDIKLPKAFSHFDKLTSKQLDELREKIKEVIAAGKIEKLLDIGVYKV